MTDNIENHNRTVTKTDVLIIGAGINGAGLFRDLAEQQLSVMIIDKADFGSGTSAAPSRLIHGGLKYIETAELKLVAQSTFERNLLLKNAPHQVSALQTTIPIFSWSSGIFAAIRTVLGSKTAPRSRGAVLIKIGLIIYDFFGARHRVMPKHKMLSKRAALKHLPQLTDSVVAAGIYYDAKVNSPERLTLEVLMDGTAANRQARAHNYMQVVQLIDGKVLIRNENGEEQLVAPKILVNAAGPWIDSVNASLGEPTDLIGGTKGSHIIIDNPALAAQLKDQMIYFEADDGRICLIFEYLDRLIVGSSDTPANDPDSVHCTDTEVSYFLDSVQALLPGANIEEDQIIYAYSGIRPLPNSDSTSPGLISRDHSTPRIDANKDRPFPIISLVGGKWTTFRGLAEEVTDSILSELKQPRLVTTKDLSIGGGKNFPNIEQIDAWIDTKAKGLGLKQVRMQTLFERYGSRSVLIASREAKNPTKALTTLPNYTDQEIEWLISQEQVTHLDDLLIRRTTLAVRGDLSEDSILELATLCGPTLGWSPERIEKEIAATLALLRQKHRMKL